MSKKFKLVQYPYGRKMGFKQDIVWFIQGTADNKTWNNYVQRNSPSIVYEKEVYHRPPMSAYLSIEEANEAFDKIIDYYRKQTDEKLIIALREVEVQKYNMKQYFIVDKATKHMVGNTVYGSAKMADMDIEKIEGSFKKYEVYAFDMNCLTKDIIVYAMTNDNPCVYKQRTR